MIWAFKKSRIGFAVIMFLSAVVAVAVWFRDTGHPIFVPAIASVLMLGVGYFSGRVLGNLISSTENTRRLGFLHMELDPRKFLEAYREIPGRIKEGTAPNAITRSYLASGHSAAGEYETALQILSQDPPAGELSIQGLYAMDRAANYLALEDQENAALQLERLQEIIDACRTKKPDLAKNLTSSLRLHTQHLRCLQGKPVDTEYLEDAFPVAQYNIRRLEIAKVLAMTALRDGDEKSAAKHLSFLRKEGGKTVFKTWADKQKI